MKQPHFFVDKNIPIEKYYDYDVLDNYDSCVKDQRDFSIKCVYFRNRYAINIVTVSTGVFAFYIDFDYAVNSREDDHKEQAKEHHFYEGKIKSDGFIHLVNVRYRATHLHGYFLSLITTGALLLTILFTLSERSCLSVQLAYV
jgi:hypothetical protein